MKNLILLVCTSLFSISSCSQNQLQELKNSKGLPLAPQKVETFINSLMDSLEMTGLSLAIINKSKIAYHQNFGVINAELKTPIDNQTLFEAASLSKPLFAFFVMKQVGKGLLDLDRPLYEYLPNQDLAHDARYKQITSRMILSHTSGLPNWRGDSLKINFDPGTHFEYSGEGYQYLADVIAKINQLPIEKLDSLFQKEITKPIGADRLYFSWNEDIATNKAMGHRNGTITDNEQDWKHLSFGAAGGLHTEAMNYANFLIAIMDKKILSPSQMNEMFSEQVRLPESDINSKILGASAWGLGFGIIPTSIGTCYWHAGNNNDDFQSWVHFYPEKEFGIVLFSNSDKVQSPDFFIPLFEFFDEAIKFDLSKLN